MAAIRLKANSSIEHTAEDYQADGAREHAFSVLVIHNYVHSEA